MLIFDHCMLVSRPHRVSGLERPTTYTTDSGWWGTCHRVNGGGFMQKDATGLTSAGGRVVRSIVGPEFEQSLIERIRPLAAEHGLKPEALAGALKEAILEDGQRRHWGEYPAEDRRSHALALVLWKLFAGGSELWITLKTPAGNAVPLNLLVTAYRMWRRAVSFAASRGVGSSDAADALAQMTHATADQLARGDRGGEHNRIRSTDNYLFASYMHLIFHISEKQGSTHLVRFSRLNDRSDEGAFQRALENSILCRELLAVMPPQGRKAAIVRYLMGFEWAEAARALKTSINAAQKAQSVGLRRAFETCMRELRKAARPKAEATTLPKENKKNAFDGE